MNISEARTALRKVLAYCPAQTVDEFTPEAWAEALHDIRLADALEAIAIIGRKEAPPGQSLFIEPRHIRHTVRKLRDDRITNHPLVDPPADLTPGEYLDWCREITARIADGETITPAAALPARRADYADVVKEIP